MGAYNRDVVVVIKISAYIHGAPILCGCLLSGIPGATTSGTINSIVKWQSLGTKIAFMQS